MIQLPKIFFSLTIASTVFCSIAKADPLIKCKDYALNFSPSAASYDPIWSRSIRGVSVRERAKTAVRNAEQEKISEIYIEAYFKQVEEIFIPWFKGEIKLPFEEMLTKSHEILSRNYGGNSSNEALSTGRGSQTIRDKTAFPGKTRTQTDPQGVWPVKLQIKYHELNIPLSNTVSALIKRARTKGDYILHRIEVADIPIEHRPQLFITPSRVWVLHPAPKSLKYYISSMAKQMQVLKKLYRKSDFGKEFNEARAKYLHFVVTAHLFVKVNFSLGMSQINAISELANLKQISHGRLDYQGLFSSWKEFERILTAETRPN